MKNLMIASALFFCGLGLHAQNDEPQPSDDQLQQQTPRGTEVRTERAAKVDAVRNQSQSNVEAEREAKQKGQTQQQTKTQPVGLNPPDNAAKPKARPELEKKNRIISE